jgi:hypothetical protein
MMPLVVSGPIYYQWHCRFGILFSIIGTLLVKITDENAKEAQVQKSVKYWKLGFYRFNS